MWRSKRGKEIARRHVFHDLPYKDYYYLPMQLFAAEVIHEMALPGELNTEQDTLIWTFVGDALDSYRAGTIRVDQVLPMAGIWKGPPPVSCGRA